jgi:hypothetical protein
MNAVRLQALHRANPPAADCVGWEARRRTYGERETGREELYEIK